MKKTIPTLLLAISVLLLGVPTFAQKTAAQKNNEDAAKRTEKIQKKITDIGTGERATITVQLNDNSTVKGYVSESNDKSFVVIDKTDQRKTINYSEVVSVSHNPHASNMGKYILIGVGAAVVAVVLILVHIRCTNEPGTC